MESRLSAADLITTISSGAASIFAATGNQPVAASPAAYVDDVAVFLRAEAHLLLERVAAAACIIDDVARDYAMAVNFGAGKTECIAMFHGARATEARKLNGGGASARRRAQGPPPPLPRGAPLAPRRGVQAP